ncbi:MAG: hypothetical protein MJZ62_06720 [Bacteroidales bacterium]|nr:hypothetical protein [Bacteroidales bacterium]
MKRNIGFFLLAILLSTPIWGQRKVHAQITGDVAVTKLVEKNIEFNDQIKTVPGYRIKIASLSGTNSKTAAFALKDKFLATYPDLTAYLVFDEPNFVIKVGDFTNRLDAFIFLQRIKSVYPGSIIQDQVYPIRLNWDDLIPEKDSDAEE